MITSREELNQYLSADSANFHSQTTGARRLKIFNLKSRQRYHGVGLIKDIFLYHLPYYLFYKKDIKAAACFLEAFFSGYKKNPDKGYLKWMKIK